MDQIQRRAGRLRLVFAADASGVCGAPGEAMNEILQSSAFEARVPEGHSREAWAIRYPERHEPELERQRSKCGSGVVRRRSEVEETDQ